MNNHRGAMPKLTQTSAVSLGHADHPRWKARPGAVGAICAGWLLLAPAYACGPDFPMTLLDRREAVMSGLPEGVFGFEISQLLAKPADTLVPVEAGSWDDPDAGRRSAETAGLTAAAGEHIATMRAAASADAARALTGDLPADVATYTVGAVAWAQGDFERAEAEFRSVLALPEADRTHRGVWASFMLGRARALSGDLPSAAAAFEQTRTMVRAGASDPLGLAVASLGEQARAARAAGDIVAAVRLYAEQAAYGSSGGHTSLLFVARAAIRDPAQVDALLTDDVGTRLLLAFLYARYNELIDIDPNDEYPNYDAPADGPRVLALLERIAQATNIPAPDRVAAIAYRAGRFEQAAQLVAKSDSALAAWVRAKLALRAGDLDAAASEYAQAAKGFPATEHWGEVPLSREDYVREDLKPRCRVQAEAGTLALSRGDYLQALELLYASADVYWADAAYIAERVVSVDELKTFVDRVAPTALPAADASAEAAAERDYYLQEAPAHQLRRLLARRLLREGKLDVALGYFDNAERRQHATHYVEALARTKAWTRVDQARAWFDAAEVARWHGMEILGFEGDPDYANWFGDFDLNSPITWDEDYNPVFHARSDLKIEGPYTSDGERQRVAASRAQPLERFHYRLTAAGLAGKAADLLPARSQAFAAVLCEATRWLIDRQPDQARDLYQRYLREGPYVPWGASFGRACPAPDFDKVEAEIRAGWLQRIRHGLMYATPAMVLFALGIWWMRRRQGIRAKLSA